MRLVGWVELPTPLILAKILHHSPGTAIAWVTPVIYQHSTEPGNEESAQSTAFCWL